MDTNEKKLDLFTTRMRQLILLFKDTKKENNELYAMLDQQEKQIAELKGQLAQAQRDYDSLKMARMLEVTDGDVENAKKKVARMIRDIDKCIALISGKE